MSLLALICPQCSAALDVAPERRVLVCDTCAKTWTVPEEGDRLAPTARTLVRPERVAPEGAEIVLLPMWLVSLHVESIPQAPPSLPTEVRIPAVGVRRLPVLLHFARNLTRAPLVWQPWEGAQAPVDPAELTPADAYALAETVVLRHVDGWPDDRMLAALELPFGTARLVDWPCARIGSELIELVGGLSTQRALVDAADLRDRRPQLESALAARDAAMPR